MNQTAMNERDRALIVTRADRMDAFAWPPRDRPADGTVRVAVDFAGVGFADVRAVAGGYALAPRLPFSPGYEFEGTVVEVASRTAAGLRIGDRVCGMLTSMGAYRRIIDVPAALVIPLPENVDVTSAAALPLNYITALAMIERIARLERGDSLLVHGAGGGVGTAVLELARALGIQAYGTASAAKRDIVTALGATHIDYRTGPWLATAMRARPSGFNAVFDPFGGSIQRDSWRALAKRGTLVSYGFYGEPQRRNAALTGIAFLATRALVPGRRQAALCRAPHIVLHDPAWYRDAMKRLLALLAAGEITPVVDSVVPWRDASCAHERLAAREARGKIVLDFRTP